MKKLAGLGPPGGFDGAEEGFHGSGILAKCPPQAHKLRFETGDDNRLGCEDAGGGSTIFDLAIQATDTIGAAVEAMLCVHFGDGVDEYESESSRNGARFRIHTFHPQAQRMPCAPVLG